MTQRFCTHVSGQHRLNALLRPETETRYQSAVVGAQRGKLLIAILAIHSLTVRAFVRSMNPVRLISRRKRFPGAGFAEFPRREYMYDHVIIGAGVIGLAVAAKLAE
jgi:hypothetical protein